MKRRTFLKGAAALALCGVARPAAAEEPAMRIDTGKLHRRNQNRSTVACRHGMVCASQPLAAMAGIDMLKAGGSAIDAAICANAMLSLVEPMSCGPGGDLFAIVWDEGQGKLVGLNASGRSPHDWSLEAASKLGLDGIPAYSPLAWSVPGCVSGWRMLHERFGRLDRERILAPVIETARQGFPLSPVIGLGWGIHAESHPTLAEAFLPNGEKPPIGGIITNPDLAGFYEILSREGWQAFYEGDIARRIVEFSKAAGGRFSIRDFTSHAANWVDPVSAAYRGYDVWELPPNGQGIAALQILNLLEHFDIGAMEPNSAPQLHLFLEAKKLAFEDRARYYADMAMADVPVEWLISKEYAAERVKRINPKRAAESVKPGEYRDESNTVYLTAADSEGNMVSLIQSIYHAWGSRIVPAKLGFPLQNRGRSFALDPGHRNRLEPNKRPFHTIIPAFVTQAGRPRFSFGVMGGDFQPQGHAQVLMNWIDFGMSPQQAGEQPRLAHDGSSEPTGRPARGSGIVTAEEHIPEAVLDALRAMGHNVSRARGMHGGYQAIARLEDPLRYFGGSDPRKDGAALGY